jgi:hypothetical protein
MAETAFNDWKRTAERLFKRDYSISLADAGIEDAQLRLHLTAGEAPEDFVNWFAEKYDLTPLRNWRQ